MKFDPVTDRAKRLCPRIVFPEAQEDRVARAMQDLAQRGLCQPVSVTDDATDEQVAAIMSARGSKETLARKMLTRPLYRAAAMVAAGEADAMVAGADSPTRRVIEAAIMAIGLADGVSLPSSFFLMQLADGRQMIFADCAVTVDPDAEALAAIARASAASAEALIGPARVALLSFSTGTSGTGPSVDRVRAASEATGFAGPIQADAALNAAIAQKKGFEATDANVLIFPSLDAGNIAYKLLQELAGAQAIGPILQGFRKPVCDLSRGASTDDIVASTIITAAMCTGPA